LYSPSGPSWPVLGLNAHLPFVCLYFLSSKALFPLLVEILQEANNSSYNSLAEKRLGLQQKKLILFDFISFLRLSFGHR
jgi:hypothetical protein